MLGGVAAVGAYVLAHLARMSTNFEDAENETRLARQAEEPRGDLEHLTDGGPRLITWCSRVVLCAHLECATLEAGFRQAYSRLGWREASQGFGVKLKDKIDECLALKPAGWKTSCAWKETDANNTCNLHSLVVTCKLPEMPAWLVASQWSQMFGAFPCGVHVDEEEARVHWSESIATTYGDERTALDLDFALMRGCEEEIRFMYELNEKPSWPEVGREVRASSRAIPQRGCLIGSISLSSGGDSLVHCYFA